VPARRGRREKPEWCRDVVQGHGTPDLVAADEGASESRLAQPQQLTGKLFTSFRSLKFPDAGVVSGGAVWLLEYM